MSAVIKKVATRKNSAASEKYRSGTGRVIRIMELPLPAASFPSM